METETDSSGNGIRWLGDEAEIAFHRTGTAGSTMVSTRSLSAEDRRRPPAN